jgi:serpin B
MRTSNAFSLVLGTILLVGLWNAPGSTSAAPIYAPLVAGNTDFALNLFGQVAGTNNANVFFSPYSISACFGMVYAGARGDTALEMAAALDLSTNQAGVGPEFGALQAELATQQGQDSIILSVANGLWAQTNYPFLPAFVANASNNYDASVQSVDFTTEAPQITDAINDWVANQTAGMISNLFAPGTLTGSTRLALVDAIYFNGGWQSVFNTNLTTSAPFYVSPGQSVNVPTMEQMEIARYYEDGLLQAVELPYMNSNITMVVLLPNINGPLTLTPGELSAVFNGFLQQYVNVQLPKFKLETTIDLAPILENLGMVDAFVPGAADFSGIDGAWDLSIGSARHKAVVDVNETGTVAAGATGITITTTAVSHPALFQANHPFIFLIRDTNSASILFMGQVGNPAAGSAPGPAPPLPLIQTADGSFGVRSHQFGFKVTGTNATLVVELCTNLVGGAWIPIQTLTLTNGSACFSEPWAANSPGRYYRVRSP